MHENRLNEKDIKQLVRAIRKGLRSIDEFGDIEIAISPQLQLKGKNFFKKHEDKLKPFERNILNKFSHFSFLGFHRIKDDIFPIYKCYSTENKWFEYIFAKGNIEILSISVPSLFMVAFITNEK